MTWKGQVRWANVCVGWYQSLKLNDFMIWGDVESPKSTVFNYPLRTSSGKKP
jgi:hypothetical protein